MDIVTVGSYKNIATNNVLHMNYSMWFVGMFLWFGRMDPGPHHARDESHKPPGHCSSTNDDAEAKHAGAKHDAPSLQKLQFERL